MSWLQLNGYNWKGRAGVATAAALIIVLAGCTTTEQEDRDHGSRVDDIAALVPEELQSKKRLVVGSSVDFAPMEFYPENSTEPDGFEINLGDAIGDVLGLEVEWVNASFDGLLTGVAARRYDLAISSLVDLPERRKEVLLIDYALNSNGLAVLASKSGAPETANGMCGRSAAVQRGSSAVQDAEKISSDCLAEGAQAVTVRQYQNQNQVMLAVKSDRADAAIGGRVWLEYVASQSPGTFTVLEDKIAPVPFGIAVPKDEPALGLAIAKALEHLIESGAYQDLIKKWGLPGIAVTEVTINDGDLSLNDLDQKDK